MDDRETATTLFEKLYAIKELGPGQKPMALDKARGTLQVWAQHSDSSVQQQAQGALHSFETWFSARKWNRSNDRGCSAESTLVDAISKLCDAIDALAQRRQERNALPHDKQPTS